MDMHSEPVESEYFRKLLDRHHAGASKSDIRIAFRDFLVRTEAVQNKSDLVPVVVLD